MSEPKVILTLSEYKKITSEPDIYYGTEEPSAELGKDGDLYFQYDEEA